MKLALNRLMYAFVFLFVAAIVVAAYRLYTLPVVLADKAGVMEQIPLGDAQQELSDLTLLVFGVSFFGLSSLIMAMITRKNSDEENIVYVESYRDKEEESAVETSLQAESKYKDKIKEIEQIISRDASDKVILNRALSKICKDMEASHGAFYRSVYEEDRRYIELFASYAYSLPDSKKVRYEFGEGLSGQAAKEGKPLILNNVPEGYIKILSGLGSSSPTSLIIMPLIREELTIGVIEIASFHKFTSDEEEFLKYCASLLSKSIFTDMDTVLSEVATEKDKRV